METPTPTHASTSQAGRILKLLKQHRKVTNRQLNAMGIFRYSARIADLRIEGHIIETQRVHDGLWEFIYHGHRDDERTL
ncbi:helix-turn-helix domain-containing protein [Rhodococcus qingshengii]|uniref:helix-turn-helix domain-containing protein n=1 Tax=Rhodococcus qingshengii TaxID=334542 RepID=UPI002943DC79|nr:helix-turn-helix domain-containing protein [Rhodococcus qingshengii]WOI85956.1 helix-turn-helix domain-containing protein [Rhodococcus qingshengii]